MKVPATESDLRTISLESFVLDWLKKEIGHKLDITQYGGLKGQSTTHYIIDLVNFLLYNQDIRVPQAVLAIM